MERNNLLEVEHLSVHIPSTAGTVQAVRDVSFAVAPGEVLALVGESGCGKSILCKSVMKLLPKRASIVSGTIRADGQGHHPLLRTGDAGTCGESCFPWCSKTPLTALNPTIPIGKQIAEAVTIHQKGLSKAQVQERVIELMTLVGASPTRWSGRSSIPTTSLGGCASDVCWPWRWRGVRRFYLPTSRPPLWT